MLGLWSEAAAHCQPPPHGDPATLQLALDTLPLDTWSTWLNRLLELHEHVGLWREADARAHDVLEHRALLGERVDDGGARGHEGAYDCAAVQAHGPGAWTRCMDQVRKSHTHKSVYRKSVYRKHTPPFMP